MSEYQQWTCDVLVIGAGPAGSMAARFAAQEGAAVILLERRERVGLPVRCAEYVPLPVSRYVELNRPGLLVQTVRAMQTFIPGDAVKETVVPGAIINRDRLDQELAGLAVKAGAELKTGIQAWTRQGDQVVAREKEGLVRISSRVIIGADGPSSQVGRWMGSGHKEFLISAQYRISLTRPLDHTRIYFRPYIQGGYGWLFPKGGEANLGVGIVPSLHKGLKKVLDQFKMELAQEDLIKDAIKRQGGGILPVGGLIPVAKENMILAGDAAGTCHPITGAGVGNALLSGEMAGQAAAEAVRKGNFQSLKQYEKELRGLLGHSLNLGVRKRKAMMARWNRPDFSETIRQNWIAFREYYK
ncbi:MAG: NAD(P)/FAD-dependent oxidoreductase [Deltaproteobacteria bacterium]|nr:NAD(P)/FAD-dependent oxidoreductase [Deltaproteobacteria bacterium]